MSEELADKGQQDKRNGRGIDEHEHRDGVFDDGAQSNVGNGKRKHREEDRPGAVGNFAVRHLDKRLRAGRDKADGGLEAGKGDGEGEDKLAHAAEVMTRDLREGDAAIFGQLENASRLRADQNGQHVDQRHQRTGKKTGGEHVLGDDVVVVDTHAANDVDDHDAEGETGDGVHRAVALNERGKEGTVLIGLRRLDRGDRCAGGEQRRDDQHCEEEQEERIDDLANPEGDLTGAQREEQHEGEERRRKGKQIQPLRRIRAQQGSDAGGKGNCCASRDGEERADGQVQKAGKENAVALADLARERLQAVGMRDADGGDAEDGDADRRDDKADHGDDRVAAGHLAEMYGEDQVARAEEHSKQRSGDENLLPEGQFFSSHGIINSFVLKILHPALEKEKRSVIIGILQIIIPFIGVGIWTAKNLKF